MLQVFIEVVVRVALCSKNTQSKVLLFSMKAFRILRELSFLKLGTGVEEFLEGYQIFWRRFLGVSNISEKIVKYLMGCEIFGIYFRLNQELCIILQQKFHLFLLCSYGKKEVI